MPAEPEFIYSWFNCALSSRWISMTTELIIQAKVLPVRNEAQCEELRESGGITPCILDFNTK
jgi:hypothetical protein